MCGRTRARPWLCPSWAKHSASPRLSTSVTSKLAEEMHKRESCAASHSRLGSLTVPKCWAVVAATLSALLQCSGVKQGVSVGKILAVCLEREMNFLLRFPKLIPGLAVACCGIRREASCCSKMGSHAWCCPLHPPSGRLLCARASPQGYVTLESASHAHIGCG